MTETLPEVTGGCTCGAVRYRAADVGREVTECHCSQCRKQTGHRHADTGTTPDKVTIEGAGHVTWFRASPEAERGFCATCGSHLFWNHPGMNYLGLSAASIDEPTGLRMVKHIFVESKGDYYDITDGLPQFIEYETPAE
jgi:hypothetical protein